LDGSKPADTINSPGRVLDKIYDVSVLKFSYKPAKLSSLSIYLVKLLKEATNL
jgi:hypothetical protein